VRVEDAPKEQLASGVDEFNVQTAKKFVTLPETDKLFVFRFVNEFAVIRARNRRQAMDWALALASQEIEAIITRLEEGGWGLLVDECDEPAARATLRQYEVENRGWNWKQPLAGSGLVFHWGSAAWALAIIAAYYVFEVRFPQLEQAGMVDSKAVRAGEWWRLFTAVTLHENLPHLMANATTGLLLLGLAMARFGAGVSLLAAFIAGAAGNWAGILIYPDHLGLGASGMVMGALGLLAAQSVGWWRRNRSPLAVLLRAGAAASLVLVLIGFSPGTDVVAHVGGFVAGAIIGAALSHVDPAKLQSGPINSGAILGVIALAGWTWMLAR